MKTLTRGFTLIELLVVIAIIAILSSIVITSIFGSKAKSRDAKRVSDIAQIQLAIEQYFDRCQQYPAAPLNTGASTGCPPGSGITLASFIAQIPTDPSTGVIYDYAVYTAGGALGPSDYILHTKLETNAASLKDSLATQPNPTTPSWFNSQSVGWQCANTTATAAPFDYCIGSR